MGSQTTGAALASDGGEELEVLLSGVKTFAQLRQIKAALQDQFKAAGTVEERKLSRNEMCLAVKTKKPIEEVKRGIASVKIEGTRLMILETMPSAVRVEVK